MNNVQWFLCCAVVALFVANAPRSVQAQFGSAPADGDSPAANPASSAEGAAPADEKSVLAKAVENATADASSFCRCVGDAESVAGSRIEGILDRPLHSTGLDFADTPLADVVNLLQEDYGIPIQLDTKALDEVGIGSDQPVSVNLHNISLRSALRLMLKPHSLTTVIQDEVLVITTPEAAESQLSLCVYDVRNLMSDTSAKSFDDVIDMITACVATETWAENGGGEAEIRPLNRGILVISQTQAVHEEIRALLKTIREMRDRQPAVADRADAGVESAPSDEQVVTRAYYLQMGPGGDAEKVRTQIRELIMQSIPDEQWSGRLDDGQPIVLSILPDRVVLRHKPAVHDQVQSLLSDSGLSVQPAAGEGGMMGAAPQGSGGGGFFQPDPAAAP